MLKFECIENESERTIFVMNLNNFRQRRHDEAIKRNATNGKQ